MQKYNIFLKYSQKYYERRHNFDELPYIFDE